MRHRKPEPPLVALRWRDAHGTATAQYEPHELPHAALEIVTYGLLLRDDAIGVSVACEDCGGNVYRGVTFVPRELVVECRPVRTARTRKAPAAAPESA